jgi:microsomal dipeptidase-like Zn-dependent dipeptidase
MHERLLQARDLLRRFPLFAELLARDWTEPDCAALAGGNLLRALRAAESFAATSGQGHTR